MAHIYTVKKRHGDYERTMIQAYKILDKYPDSEVKAKLGNVMFYVDKEMAAATSPASVPEPDFATPLP